LGLATRSSFNYLQGFSTKCIPVLTTSLPKRGRKEWLHFLLNRFLSSFTYYKDINMWVASDDIMSLISTRKKSAVSVASWKAETKITELQRETGSRQELLITLITESDNEFCWIEISWEQKVFLFRLWIANFSLFKKISDTVECLHHSYQFDRVLLFLSFFSSLNVTVTRRKNYRSYTEEL